MWRTARGQVRTGASEGDSLEAQEPLGLEVPGTTSHSRRPLHRLAERGRNRPTPLSTFGTRTWSEETLRQERRREPDWVFQRPGYDSCHFQGTRTWKEEDGVCLHWEHCRITCRVLSQSRIGMHSFCPSWKGRSGQNAPSNHAR